MTIDSLLCKIDVLAFLHSFHLFASLVYTVNASEHVVEGKLRKVCLHLVLLLDSGEWGAGVGWGQLHWLASELLEPNDRKQTLISFIPYRSSWYRSQTEHLACMVVQLPCGR